jgi:hypothetical protein
VSQTKLTPALNKEPKLRHEFVGMMFAVAIGEVGLQAASLLQAGQVLRFLPAYTHLILATLLIATSWVGWTLSLAPGARRDVSGIFEWEFVVLLLDVLLVILYFVLVRSVDFAKDQAAPHIAPASNVASLIAVIFALYLMWDFLTKVLVSWKHRGESKRSMKQHFDSLWWCSSGVRMLPSLLCFIISWVTVRLFQGVDPPHMLTADVALIALVLLFRALKDLASSFTKRDLNGKLSLDGKARMKRAVRWTTLCGVALLGGLLWSAYSIPLPARIMSAMRLVPSAQK